MARAEPTAMSLSSGPVDDGRTRPPVSRRGRWLGGGLVVQLVGVGLPAAYLGARAHRMSVPGHVTAASVRLAWRADAHTGVGLTLLIAGAVMFAVGSILMARPFVRRRTTLLAAVPVAALVGVLGLGVLAVVLAAIVAGWVDWFDLFDPSGLPAGRDQRKQHTRTRTT